MPVNQRSFYVPMAAFGMAIILTGYTYTSISSARRNAHEGRQEKFDQILESRKRLGIDAWDQRKERERLRAEKEKEKEKEKERGTTVESAGNVGDGKGPA